MRKINLKSISLFESGFNQRKIRFGYKYISDISSLNSNFQSKIFEFEDYTNLGRVVLIGFDLEGRILYISLKSIFSNAIIKILERSFDGNFFVYEENCKNLKSGKSEIYSYHDYYNESIYSNSELSKFLMDSVKDFLKDIKKNLAGKKNNYIISENPEKEVKRVFEKIYNMNSQDQILANKQLWRKLYPSPITVVPPEVRPDQNPIFCIVQITQGCRLKEQRGPCYFCDSYDKICYNEKKKDELLDHLLFLREYFGEGWTQVKKVFLSDADPLYSTKSSIEYFNILKIELPNINCYESFISTLGILSKSEKEWKALMSMGLKKVYWGVESADNETLGLLGKPHNKKLLYKAAVLLDKIGLDFVVILMSGIGNLSGKFSSSDNKHINESADFVRNINCNNVYISRLMIMKNTKMHQLVKDGLLKPPSNDDRELEHRAIIKRINTGNNSTEKQIVVIKGTYGVQFNQ